MKLKQERGRLYHASEIPAEMMRWFEEIPIEEYPTRPAIVLDIFSGSGTSCIAAKELGRYSIGIDISGDYLALAKHRLERVTTPMEL